ncbi:MAG: 4Fe-4S cluster-binding domain-containing protein [Actinobacteria bacterium]|nr:4Fe-4S cluster-binding domain-containing protein [Actinomycetota bacterium]
MLERCTLCPHRCGANRLAGDKGFCGAGANPSVSTAMPHYGEEPPISGTGGSGTIFFSHCNMQCVYCQNYQISQGHHGNEISISTLARHMIDLKEKGCHNVNLVSPTIWVPQIATALAEAGKSGFDLPLVYNTGGYDLPGTIKMLDGIIDIYMPDMRYSDPSNAGKYSGIMDYVKYNRNSVKEMYEQVGGLKLDRNGIAVKGVMIRLLVLPGNIAGIKDTLDFIRSELSTDVYLSIMAQYYPAYRASGFPPLSRRITREEYLDVVEYAGEKGFDYGYIQDVIPAGSGDPFIPDFKDGRVFKYYRK